MNLEEKYEELKNQRLNKVNDEKKIIGKCLSFCPEFETIERLLRKDVSMFEKEVLIKKYQRSSAGKQKSLPEDVRPIKILEETFDYLIYLLKLHIKDKPNEIYKFVEDRCRAIRQDISIQSLESDRAISLLERICRFHIFSNHYFYDLPEFDLHLNIDQIRRILTTLMNLYGNKNINHELFNLKSIIRKKSSITLNLTENEDEFMSYFIVSNMSDNNVYYKTCKYSNKTQTYFLNSSNNFTEYDSKMDWTSSTQQLNIKKCNRNVELALKLMIAYQRNNWIEFFNIFRKSSFMFSAATLAAFDMQKRAIKCMQYGLFEKINIEWVRNQINSNTKDTVNIIKRVGLSIEEEKVNFREKEINPIDITFVPEKIKELEDKRLDDISLYINFGDFVSKVTDRIIESLIKHIVFHKMNENRQNKPESKNYEINDDKRQNVEPKIKKRYIKDENISDICKEILDENIKNLIFGKIKNYFIEKRILKFLSFWRSKIKNNRRNEILCVTDKSLFSAVLRKKIIDFIKNVEFAEIKNIDNYDLFSYRFIIVSIPEDNIQTYKNKYFMLNTLIDTPMNIMKLIDSNILIERINKSKFIKKSRLLDEIRNLDRDFMIKKLCNILKSNRNDKKTEEIILKVINENKFEDCDVYYEI